MDAHAAKRIRKDVSLIRAYFVMKWMYICGALVPATKLDHCLAVWSYIWENFWKMIGRAGVCNSNTMVLSTVTLLPLSQTRLITDATRAIDLPIYCSPTSPLRGKQYKGRLRIMLLRNACCGFRLPRRRKWRRRDTRPAMSSKMLSPTLEQRLDRMPTYQGRKIAPIWTRRSKLECKKVQMTTSSRLILTSKLGRCNTPSCR